MNLKLILDIIIYIFSILGGVVSIYTIYKLLIPQKFVSWKRVEKGIINIKDKLLNDNYIPTLIVGIGRGGSVTGALLSGCLGNIPIFVIDRVYDWDKEGRHEKIFDEINLKKNLEKVLLVAGELHTGGTARTFIHYFNLIGAKNIRVFSFLKEKYPALPPDYFCLESDNPDIRLPWMITRNYKRDSKIDGKNKK